MDSREELRQIRLELQQLKSAIPPLPSPAQLYDGIVKQCWDNHEHTQTARRLEDHVHQISCPEKILSISTKDVDLLDMQLEHLRLQFLFSRAHLRTLFTLPPLLIARKRMSKAFWSTLMNQKQEVKKGVPLLMDLPTLETIISDQLQNIATMKAKVQEVRTETQRIEESERRSFEEEMREWARQTNQALAELKLEKSSATTHEEEIIKNNSMYMEAIDTDDGEEAEDIDGNRVDDGEEKNREKQEPAREQECPAQGNEERRHIEDEIRCLRQS
ncbi:hypothetical protein Q1695_012129 [Nippostrongylus brasiliensis]|nr:hypothetical protein Q1695_012129 [Nippostrongylus brasiliensis]